MAGEFRWPLALTEKSVYILSFGCSKKSKENDTRKCF